MIGAKVKTTSFIPCSPQRLKSYETVFKRNRQVAVTAPIIDLLFRYYHCNPDHFYLLSWVLHTKSFIEECIPCKPAERTCLQTSLQSRSWNELLEPLWLFGLVSSHKSNHNVFEEMFLSIFVLCIDQVHPLFLLQIQDASRYLRIPFTFSSAVFDSKMVKIKNWKMVNLPDRLFCFVTGIFSKTCFPLPWHLYQITFANADGNTGSSATCLLRSIPTSIKVSHFHKSDVKQWHTSKHSFHNCHSVVLASTSYLKYTLTRTIVRTKRSHWYTWAIMWVG